MFKMSDLNSAKKQSAVNQEKKTENYEKVLKEGMNLYEQFSRDNKEKTLKHAADKFFEALHCKSTQMEPYLFLSMIFYLFDQEKTARKYFSTAAEMMAERPELNELKENMQNLLYKSAA